MSAALALPSPARAYRTAAEELGGAVGESVTWPGARVELELSIEGVPELERADFERAVREGALAWSGLPCTSLRIDITAARAAAASGDGRSTISYLPRGWIEAGLDPDAAAFTDLRVERRRDAGGERLEIVEADIMIRGEAVAASDALVIAAIVRHEIGHAAIGLGHPCGDARAPPCDGAQSFADSVLYPDQHRDLLPLSADDVDGACSTYPTAACSTISCGTAEVCVEGACRAAAEIAPCAPGTTCSSDPPPLGELGDACLEETGSGRQDPRRSGRGSRDRVSARAVA